MFFPCEVETDYRAGLVHRVDSLVRKRAVSDVPVGKLYSGLYGFISVFYLVELLVIGFELCQNFDRHIDVCGLNDDLLETSVKGSVLLHYFSEFIHGRRPYALDFAPCEGRFQHIGGVEASLGPSGTDYCMELIDKEYEVRIGPGLFYYRFQPLFKVSPEFGSGYYRCYIQRKDSFLCKRRGNIA